MFRLAFSKLASRSLADSLRITRSSTIGQRLFSSSASGGPASTPFRRRLSAFLAPQVEHPRYSQGWWVHQSIVMVVFAITGSTTAYLVRPLVSKYLGLQGSFKDGPWSYRIVSLIVMMPVYSVLLVSVGTVFGKHAFFKQFAIRMWTRMFFIKSK